MLPKVDGDPGYEGYEKDDVGNVSFLWGEGGTGMHEQGSGERKRCMCAPPCTTKRLFLYKTDKSTKEIMKNVGNVGFLGGEGHPVCMTG